MNKLKQYAAVIAVLVIGFCGSLSIYCMSESYEIKQTVIDLPDSEIQPVRSYGENVGDGV